MFRVLNRGNTQVIETVCEAFGALKYKSEFKALGVPSLKNEPTSDNHPSVEKTEQKMESVTDEK